MFFWHHVTQYIQFVIRSHPCFVRAFRLKGSLYSRNSTAAYRLPVSIRKHRSRTATVSARRFRRFNRPPPESAAQHVEVGLQAETSTRNMIKVFCLAPRASTKPFDVHLQCCLFLFCIRNSQNRNSFKSLSAGAQQQRFASGFTCLKLWK